MSRVRGQRSPLLVRNELRERKPFARPTRAVTDGVLLSLLVFVAVPTQGIRVCRDRFPGTGETLLCVVTARKVVVEQAELPRRAPRGTLGAGEPSGGEHVDTLADFGQEAEVMASRLDFT